MVFCCTCGRRASSGWRGAINEKFYNSFSHRDKGVTGAKGNITREARVTRASLDGLILRIGNGHGREGNLNQGGHTGESSPRTFGGGKLKNILGRDTDRSRKGEMVMGGAVTRI